MSDAPTTEPADSGPARPTGTQLAHPPEQVVPGIWRIQVPLLVRVEPANAYVLVDDDGSLTIFDTGVAPGARELWRAALGEIGHAPGDVRRVIVSHHHPDHIGGAGAVHRLTKATMLASASTIQQAPDVWGDRGRIDSYFESIDAHLHEHGLPDDVAEQLRHESDIARMAVDLPPDDCWEAIGDGDRVEAAGRTWHVRLTPGHADGHLVLHDRDGDGLLLAGDHLLERISPAVGRFPRHERDPLARYLESLMVVAMLDPKLVLPGHGAPFEGGAERARVLVAHHHDRIDQCVKAVTALGTATAFETARRVFPHVFDAERPDPANQRFATTESLAHLERARFDGRLTRAREADGLVRYRPAAG